MFCCISQFDINTTGHTGESDKEEEPTSEERQLAALRREADLAQYTPIPISDDKEEDDEDKSEEQDNFDLAIAHVPSQPSQRVLGKRQRSFVPYAEGDDETEPQLPPLLINNEGFSQMRTSGRPRKRPKNLDDYHVRYE